MACDQLIDIIGLPEIRSTVIASIMIASVVLLPLKYLLLKLMIDPVEILVLVAYNQPLCALDVPLTLSIVYSDRPIDDVDVNGDIFERASRSIKWQTKGRIKSLIAMDHKDMTKYNQG
jgi:hypothetical protein